MTIINVSQEVQLVLNDPPTTNVRYFQATQLVLSSAPRPRGNVSMLVQMVLSDPGGARLPFLNTQILRAP